MSLVSSAFAQLRLTMRHFAEEAEWIGSGL